MTLYKQRLVSCKAEFSPDTILLMQPLTRLDATTMNPISRTILYSGTMLHATALLGLVTLSGCIPPVRVAPAVNVVRAVRAVPAFPSPAVTAMRVQAQPLYQQAVQECQVKRYKHASNLLLCLASQPGLNAQEAAFVQQQQAICLLDAHLPIPPTLCAPAPATSSPSSVTSLQKGVGALSPADADCGPRALLLLCQREGVAASLSQLRQLAGTTAEGTSLAGLEKAAKTVGLKVEGVQVSREALGDVDMPALAYVNGNHFIAVLSIQGRGEDATATVHDPNNAQEQTIGQERLLRLCSGYMLLARK